MQRSTALGSSLSHLLCKQFIFDQVEIILNKDAKIAPKGKRKTRGGPWFTRSGNSLWPCASQTEHWHGKIKPNPSNQDKTPFHCHGLQFVGRRRPLYTNTQYTQQNGNEKPMEITITTNYKGSTGLVDQHITTEGHSFSDLAVD